MTHFPPHFYSLTAAAGALVLPLFAFSLLGLFGRSLPHSAARIAVICSFFSFICALLAFTIVLNQGPTAISLPFLNTGLIRLQIGIRLDLLSVFMLLLITSIALPVFLYSTAYMRDQSHYLRYFTQLSLFLFAMLGLVLADSLFLLYIFWELVGFASYLLIGYWYKRDSASSASKKAFLINRFGDLAFLIGMMILLSTFGTLDLSQLFGSGNTPGMVARSFAGHAPLLNNLFQSLSGESAALLPWAGLCLFIGAMAKSAQFPLHVWLPDAMEGPTAVSSLIHAATMVAAGIYLMLRIFPLFSPDVLLIITSVGTFTAFFAATIALTQTDLKKILAYSTISQLGFMTAAIGLGAWPLAFFHLATHAFFKCVLFLSAGSVIHGLEHVREQLNLRFDPQDIRLMGGMRKSMPFTFAALLIAALSLAGLPFFSGYLSKDLILIQAWSWGIHQNGFALVIPFLLTLTTILTAFYIFRLLFSIFGGQSRLNILFPGALDQLHESPKVMTYPMIALALACFYFLFSQNPLHAADSWIPVGMQFTQPTLNMIPDSDSAAFWVPIVTVIGALLMMVLCKMTYADRKLRFLPPTNPLYIFSYNGWYINSLYQIALIKPLLSFARFIKAFDLKAVDGLVNASADLVLGIARISDWIDRRLVDGLINAIGRLSMRIGNFFRGFQTGKVQQHMAFALIGLLLMMAFLIWMSLA